MDFYIYPLFEGDRFVSRPGAKGDRDAGLLRITGFWSKAGFRYEHGSITRLSAELVRFAHLGGLQAVPFAP